MRWLLLFSVLWYSWIILRRWLAWRRMPVTAPPAAFQPSTAITVIIPVRNEAENILHLLRDLERQRYPRELLEVLVIDDHSDDETATLVEEFILASGLQAKYLQLENYVKYKGKKAAVQVGVEQARGELLVFTDGDCRVGPEWLRSYAFVYETEQPYFISGPVSFHNTHTHFERMQLVEFSSLIGIGGASIALGQPNMCNGANLAYRKDIFERVGGFAGNETIASGDDEFLLHKVHQAFPERVKFLKSPEAIIYTSARKTLISFVQQRVRWASKWKFYQNLPVQLVALSVFLVNLLLFLAIPAVLWGNLPAWAFLLAYLTKFAVDFLFLREITNFLQARRFLWYFLPLQFVYTPYVLITAVWGLWGRYHWKGRTIKTYERQRV
ncbi:Glycosyltransferase, catalytic subunit of cellulose synthase and poly-beta-1,6-N-acetylglucosamine synthase [Pontibacter chinhatensis]|uniref:Glycosyltransferase, catalytic subunit of cellulose synthase and poly-beta-1,6-N-acetylglucosamine synthase n=2 Tax=Pontibacter chinhatensis TaxID=1436961 RepID=A0A1I2ZCE6_9BACT|nr:Glycosyltransferase, catalytic subunit of cellulose synthase and poly-beta-1,6-N-acetylglucosamine synthase [Pontibacter chinhatensis]